MGEGGWAKTEWKWVEGYRTRIHANGVQGTYEVEVSRYASGANRKHSAKYLGSILKLRVEHNNDIEVNCCNVRSKVSREMLALHEHGVG